ncbi:MAG: tetratricopeptide repeat protein [Verrucomicrobiota bacterium]
MTRLLLLLLPLSTLAVEPLPLGNRFWQSDEFLAAFAGSYRVNAAIEPIVTDETHALLLSLQEPLKKGQRKTALSRLQASPLTSKSAPLLFNQGNLQFELGQLDEAAESFRAALALTPDFRRAHRNLGILHFRQEKPEEALTHLTRAIQLGDNEALTWGLLGHIRQNQGQERAALDAYRLARLLEPENPQWISGLAQALAANDQLPSALRTADEWVASDPESPLAYFTRSLLHQQAGDYPAAAADLVWLRETEELSAPQHLDLALLLLRLDLAEEARTAFQQAFEDETPPRPERALQALTTTHRLQAHALLPELMQRFDDAYSDLAPDLASARQRLETLHLAATGQNQLALPRLETLVAENPGDGEALLALARLLQTSQPGQAKLLLEQAAHLADWKQPALRALAQLLIAQGAYPAAVETLDQLLSLSPPDEKLQEYRDQLAQLALPR